MLCYIGSDEMGIETTARKTEQNIIQQIKQFCLGLGGL
jgi:hypothetical protein